uniref:RRM domain-containing protein n=1 Tax=Zea mays TaxID=4577 RepID=A0A804P5M0_MAIZE
MKGEGRISNPVANGRDAGGHGWKLASCGPDAAARGWRLASSGDARDRGGKLRGRPGRCVPDGWRLASGGVLEIRVFGKWPGRCVPDGCTGTVKVHNVSLKASEQDISEFFSFFGEIVHVELKSCDERSQFAYITFRDNQGAERDMLLTGATIEDMAVIITPAIDYKLPAFVLADLESKNTGGMESALQKAEDIAVSMLAKGFVLGMDAVEKAKAFVEKHQLTSTATAKVASLDRTMGLSQKFSTRTLVVNEKMKEMDEKYQVAEKTKSALAATEQTVSTASSVIMSNRYILTGAAWVTDAYNKVATTTTDASKSIKERMMAEQEGANQSGETAKVDLLEISEANEQEWKRHEDDSTKNVVQESPEMTC